MMEVEMNSEKFGICSQMTRLVTRKDFIEFIRRESLKSYKIAAYSENNISTSLPAEPWINDSRFSIGADLQTKRTADGWIPTMQMRGVEDPAYELDYLRGRRIITTVMRFVLLIIFSVLFYEFGRI